MDASRSKIKCLRDKNWLWYNFSMGPKKFPMHPSLSCDKNYNIGLITFSSCIIWMLIHKENKKYKFEFPPVSKSSKKSRYSNLNPCFVTQGQKWDNCLLAHTQRLNPQMHNLKRYTGPQKVWKHKDAQQKSFVLLISSKKTFFAQDKHNVPGWRKLLLSW